LQLGNGAIFARSFRFKPDEPGHGANLARSLFGWLKHAQDKSCGLTAVIQARIRRCRGYVCRKLIVCPRAGEERQGGSGYCFT